MLDILFVNLIIFIYKMADYYKYILYLKRIYVKKSFKTNKQDVSNDLYREAIKNGKATIFSIIHREWNKEI